MIVGSVEKMSKSKNNGVDPETLIARYGADTVRLYTMFTSPPDQSLEWSDTAVEGMARFLRRFWRLLHETLDAGPRPSGQPVTGDQALAAARRRIHETIAKVDDDIGRRYAFNTAIAAVMELCNELARVDAAGDDGRAVRYEGIETVVLLLAPIVPHIMEHAWSLLGHEDSLAHASWPAVDEAALVKSTLTLAVQVNGKLRAQIQAPAAAPRETLETLALDDPNVQRHIEGKPVKKIIVVPNRLINIVV